jgi:DNA-binding SARP family transcriptional activator
MFCHTARGNRIAALKQYDDCQRALRDELSVEPSPETVALYKQIKSQAADHPSPQALFTNLPILQVAEPARAFASRVLFSDRKESVK